MPKEPARDRARRERRGYVPVLYGSTIALGSGAVSAAELAARARAAARTGYWTRLVPALAALAVLTHLPSFARTIWNPDEGYLATQARMLAGGGVLYDTVVDRKPPLLPWLYEVCFWLFGSLSLWPLRVLAIAAHLTTALFLVALARNRWGGRAGAAAGALYLMISIGLSPEDSQAATFETFMLPATAAAVWFASRRSWGAAGFAVAIAALTKQTGGAVLLPVLWMLWRDARRGRSAWREDLVNLVFGFGLPILVIALATGPKNFLFWVVTGSGEYASLGGAWLQMLGRALGNWAILAAASLALLTALAAGLRREHRAAARRAAREDADLWLWFGASWLGVITGFHFFGHYYLQLMPPLVLLGVGAVARGALGWRPVLLYTGLAAGVFCGLGFSWPHQSLEHVMKVATDVTKDTTSSETVLVWGMHPEMYWLADRRPATRYLTAGLLTNFSGGRDPESVGVDKGMQDAWQTFEKEIDHKLPEIVVDDSGHSAYSPSHIAPIAQLLRTHYERVQRVGTAVIYRLRG